jgi:hypothetical protein
MRARRGLLITTVAGLTVSGCLCGYPQTIVGNGTPETQARTVGAFQRVRFEGGVTATVTSGPRNVKVTSDSNLLEYIETFVEDAAVFVARVRPDVEVAPVVGLKVEVFNDALEGLEVKTGSRAVAGATAVDTFPLLASGGATGTITGLASTQLSVTAVEASTLTASGSATTVSITATDASLVDTRDVDATTVTVTVTDGSRATVRASGQVTGTLSGASRLIVYGGGTVTVDKSADSTVETP